MEVAVGDRYRSQVCATEIVVIRAAYADVELTCGGHPLSRLDEPVTEKREPHAELRDGTLVGKRYRDENDTIEVLVTKAGDGTLAIATTPLELATARKLPTSD